MRRLRCQAVRHIVPLDLGPAPLPYLLACCLATRLRRSASNRPSLPLLTSAVLASVCIAAMQAVLESTCALVVTASGVVASYAKDKSPTVARVLATITKAVIDEQTWAMGKIPPEPFSPAFAEPTGVCAASPTAAPPMPSPVPAPPERPVVLVDEPPEVRAVLWIIEAPAVPGPDSTRRPLLSAAACGVVVQASCPRFPVDRARRDTWCKALGINQHTALERHDRRQGLSPDPELVLQIRTDLPRTPLLTAHRLHGTHWARIVAKVGEQEELLVRTACPHVLLLFPTLTRPLLACLPGA